MLDISLIHIKRGPKQDMSSHATTPVYMNICKTNYDGHPITL